MTRACLTKTLLLSIAFALAIVCARADVLVHKDGRRIEGTITSEDGGTVKIKTTFGDLEFARADIVSIERGKTTAQEYVEREKTCKSAEDFYQLGLWAQKKLMYAQTRACMKKATELDPQHVLAQQFFGRVLYKGEWMSPEDRDKRQKSDEEAEMLARGLVRWQDKDGNARWVTPDEKTHLDKNEVQVEGKWIRFELAQHLKGLQEFDGKWLPAAEAFARIDVAAVQAITHAHHNLLLTDDAALYGPESAEDLQAIADGLKSGRGWFDATFQSAPGLALFGGRRAEFYLFTSNDEYVNTVDHFASLTTTVPPGWADSVKKTHGFLWWDPYPLSSARQWNRPPEDLVGHCYHHWGHLLLNRLGYDGRLLPPWFDEGIAALLEFRAHGRNDVYCRGMRSDKERPEGPTTGGPVPRKNDTKAAKVPVKASVVAPFDPKAMRAGQWKAALVAGISEFPPFDKLAELQFDELEMPDIAASMGIVQWLEGRGPGSLRKFLDVLRKNAPESPVRVLPQSYDRDRVYDEAFKAAAGMTWKEADAAWRAWITAK